MPTAAALTRVAVAAAVVLAVAGGRTAAAQICTVGATAVAFGVYNPTASTPTDATGTISVSCNTITPVAVGYSIQLSPGAGGTVSRRIMVSGASSITYQLYLDAAHGTVWGDGTSGSGVASGSYVLPLLGSMTRNYTVYGQIPTGQSIPPGVLADSVLVLLNF